MSAVSILEKLDGALPKASAFVPLLVGILLKKRVEKV